MLDCDRLYVGTDEGVYHLTPAGDCRASVDGGPVRDLSVHPGDPDEVLFGRALGGHGLARTPDGGETVEHVRFDDRWVWGVDRHPADPETVFVGTAATRGEPSGSVLTPTGRWSTPATPTAYWRRPRPASSRAVTAAERGSRFWRAT